MVARSRSAIRSAPRARGSPSPQRGNCTRQAGVMRSSPCVSASVKASPRCWSACPDMADETEKANLADRAGYKPWFQEHVRSSDVAHNNHVNHAVFLTYFETARVSITRDPTFGLLDPGENFNVVR